VPEREGLRRGAGGEAVTLLSYTQAAAKLAVPVGTLRAMVSRKRVPHIRLGPRVVKFDEAELDRWIESCRFSP
jgi:excisionase family DNA binding protein